MSVCVWLLFDASVAYYRPTAVSRCVLAARLGTGLAFTQRTWEDAVSLPEAGARSAGLGPRVCGTELRLGRPCGYCPLKKLGAKRNCDVANSRRHIIKLPLSKMC